MKITKLVRKITGNLQSKFLRETQADIAIPITKKIGSFGRQGQDGYYDDEIRAELVRPFGLEIYKQMELDDAVIGGLMLNLKQLIGQLEWTVESQSPELADKVKAMIESWADGSSYNLFIEIASMLTYGFYVGELILSVNEEREIWITDIEPRGQLTISAIEPKKFIEQQANDFQGYIPYAKCLHLYVPNETRNPFGFSLLRRLYKTYFYKSAIESSEAVGVDRDLAGLPVIKAPEGFDFTRAMPDSPTYSPLAEATLDWAYDIVNSVRKDESEGLVLPFGWELELLKGQAPSIDTDKIIKRYNTELSVGLLSMFVSGGLFATTSSEVVGNHKDIMLRAVDGWAKLIATRLNHILAKLGSVNGWQDKVEFKFETAREYDLNGLASFVSRLVKMGVISPTVELEETLLRYAQLPNGSEPKEITVEGQK